MVFDWFKRKFIKKEDAAPAEPSESLAEPAKEESAAATPVEEAAQVQPDYLAWAREFTFIQNQRTPPPPAPPEVVQPEPPPVVPAPQPEPEPLASNVAEVQEVQEVKPSAQEAQPVSGLPTTEEGYLALIRSWREEPQTVEPAAPINPPIEPVVEAFQSPEIAEPIQSVSSQSPTYEVVQEPKSTEAIPVAQTPPPVETTPEIAEPIPFVPSQPPTYKEAVQEPELIETAPFTQTPPSVETTPISEASEPVVASSPPVPVVSEPEPQEEDEDEPEKVPFWRKAFNWNRGASTPSVPAETISTPELIPEEAFDEGFLWSAEVLRAQGRRPEDVTVEEITWLKKLRKGLQRTSRGLVNDLKAVVGKGPISADDLDDIENLLLSADVGVASTERIIDALKVRVKKESLSAEAVFDFLKTQLKEQLEFDDPVGYAPKRGQLNVWLIVGVNGVGKTTTIGKIAHLAQQSGYKTLVAAGDTFRAAAVEQLQEWGHRSGVEVIANQGKNADPAAVVFDGIMAAQARGSELLLVDTAGRLQNKKNLMEELAKIRRIIDKKATGAHIEALLVLDASTGQNGLVQAKVFSEVANLSGVILTKLDGTARGGVALAVVEELKIPIRFIGVGEKINDLRPFNSYEFVEALLSDQS
jgi:fused signal recognition particle receptor